MRLQNCLNDAGQLTAPSKWKCKILVVFDTMKNTTGFPCGRGIEAPEEPGGRLKQSKKADNIRPLSKIN
ncbi:hypothetical protein HMPREF0971_03061 [Segatella oris F0302]|uniref:Uncharacterized protein n=1 Tax=Segatella oris F0302 TaxID=649760 RepID=D1QVM2_9BACT|nr:hypothetical protein HMPREF0971_03061 [Segatella oris F0302]